MGIEEYKGKVQAMSKEELHEELELLQESIEDIEIERKLILGQTGVHINVGKVDSYRNAFDREISTLEKKISLVKEALGA